MTKKRMIFIPLFLLCLTATGCNKEEKASMLLTDALSLSDNDADRGKALKLYRELEKTYPNTKAGKIASTLLGKVRKEYLDLNFSNARQGLSQLKLYTIDAGIPDTLDKCKRALTNKGLTGMTGYVFINAADKSMEVCSSSVELEKIVSVAVNEDDLLQSREKEYSNGDFEALVQSAKMVGEVEGWKVFMR